MRKSSRSCSSPGFSTAKQVTDLSGRGVGMDVVRQRVESLRGSIDVASQRGAGTTVTLRLPLTLAIIDGLLVTVGEAYFVLPLASTLECIELTREESGACERQARGECARRDRSVHPAATVLPREDGGAGARTDHGGGVRGRALRSGGGSGAGGLPDGDPQPGADVPARPGGIGRDDSGQRNGGADSGSAAAGAGGDSDKIAARPRALAGGGTRC